MKRTILLPALGVAAGLLALTFAGHSATRFSATAGAPAESKPPPTAANTSGNAAQGRILFSRNCAHCHGDDARGDEGPSLYNLELSDTRIAKRIKEGIKGEMPRFANKFGDGDIKALTAY